MATRAHTRRDPPNGAPNAEVFHRIVKTAPPTRGDFVSKAAQFGPPPSDATELARRTWDGVSVYRTEVQARAKARMYPWMGRFIARLEIPPGAPVRWERTYRHSRGHHTLWAPPEILLRLVVETIPV
jgi:hypothetical protein